MKIDQFIVALEGYIIPDNDLDITTEGFNIKDKLVALKDMITTFFKKLIEKIITFFKSYVTGETFIEPTIAKGIESHISSFKNAYEKGNSKAATMLNSTVHSTRESKIDDIFNEAYGDTLDSIQLYNDIETKWKNDEYKIYKEKMRQSAKLNDFVNANMVQKNVTDTYKSLKMLTVTLHSKFKTIVYSGTDRFNLNPNFDYIIPKLLQKITHFYKGLMEMINLGKIHLSPKEVRK